MAAGGDGQPVRIGVRVFSANNQSACQGQITGQCGVGSCAAKAALGGDGAANGAAAGQGAIQTNTTIQRTAFLHFPDAARRDICSIYRRVVRTIIRTGKHTRGANDDLATSPQHSILGGVGHVHGSVDSQFITLDALTVLRRIYGNAAGDLPSFSCLYLNPHICGDRQRGLRRPAEIFRRCQIGIAALQFRKFIDQLLIGRHLEAARQRGGGQQSHQQVH